MQTRNIISNGVLWLLFGVLGCFVTISFFVYGLPSLRGELSVALYADTHTYEDAATGRIYVPELISTTSNLFGPVLIFDALGHNRVAVFFFNLAVAAVGIYYLTTRENIMRVRLFFLLSTSSVFIFSFYGVNKEILIFTVSIMVYLFVRTNIFTYIAVALVLSIFIRWQMTIFCVLILIFWTVPIIKKNRKFSIIGLLASFSLVIGDGTQGALAHVNEVADLGSIAESGSGASGLFSLMLGIQNSYGYIIIFIPKTAMLLFGLIARFDLSRVADDFWNYFVIMFQSIQNLLVFGYLFMKGKIRLENDIFFIMIIYCALFSITPIFGPRYLYPVSIWAILSCCKIEDFLVQNKSLKSE